MPHTRGYDGAVSCRRVIAEGTNQMGEPICLSGAQLAGWAHNGFGEWLRREGFHFPFVLAFTSARVELGLGDGCVWGELLGGFVDGQFAYAAKCSVKGVECGLFQVGGQNCFFR